MLFSIKILHYILTTLWALKIFLRAFQTIWTVIPSASRVWIQSVTYIFLLDFLLFTLSQPLNIISHFYFSCMLKGWHNLKDGTGKVYALWGFIFSCLVELIMRYFLHPKTRCTKTEFTLWNQRWRKLVLQSCGWH